MSAQRRQRKLGGAAFLAKPASACCFWPAFRRSAGQAATTERIVVDPNRGLALSGFDPVAYFTDGKPLMGRGDWK